MAAKSKSIYLTVTPIGKLTRLLHKVFFDAKSYNEYIKTEEFKNLWPSNEYSVVREVY